MTKEDLWATLDKTTFDFSPLHPDAAPLNVVEYQRAMELRKARAVWDLAVNSQVILDNSPQPPADGEVE